MTRSIFFPIALFLLLLAGCAGEDTESDTSSEVMGTSGDPPETVSTTTRWVHSNVNIRSRPTTSSQVVETVNRGGELQVRMTEAEDGWAPVYKSGEQFGYIAERLLKTSDLPDVEISDWSWRTDPDFGNEGTIKWVAEVQNNTDRYISHVQLRFSSYDQSGSIITSTISFVQSVPPGGQGSMESYADYYGTEEKGRIQVVDILYNR